MPHRLDHLIDQLFTEEADRTLARAWAVRLDKDGVGDRTEALIREAALVANRADGTEMTPVQAREYMADFARTIGVEDHAINSSVGWLDGGAKDPKAAATDPAEVERRVAKQDAERYEKMMREKPGDYWGSKDNQRRYHEALERSLAPPVAPPLAPAGQGGNAAVAPVAAPAAPSGVAPEAVAAAPTATTAPAAPPI
jgi:hypothetical protein